MKDNYYLFIILLCLRFLKIISSASASYQRGVFWVASLHSEFWVGQSGLRLRRRLSGKERICQGRSLWRLRLSPGPGRSAGEGNGPHSGVLAWGTPWSEEPGGLQSVRTDWTPEHVRAPSSTTRCGSARQENAASISEMLAKGCGKRRRHAVPAESSLHDWKLGVQF